MILYEFYIYDHLCCMVTKNGESTLLENDQAINQLRKLDHHYPSHIHVTSRNITVETAFGNYTFINYKEVFNSDITKYCPNTLQVIDQEIKKSQKRKHRHEHFVNLKLAGFSTAIGTLALVTLVGAGNAKEQTHEHSNQMASISEMDHELDTFMNLPQIPDTVIKLETPSNQTEVMPLINTNQDAQVTYLDFESARYSITGEYAYNLYYDMVKQKAEQWGIDANLAISILTQESAGKETNLMQIEFNPWKDQIITVYNFNNNQYQKIVLTDYPENYANQSVTCITKEDLMNPKTNISVGLILLRQSIDYMHGHIGAGIQCYNFGCGNMNKVLKKTAEETGLTVSEILNDQQNLSFVDYTNIIEEGDPDYLRHVIRYVENIENGISIKTINDMGAIVDSTVYIAPVNQQTK